MTVELAAVWLKVAHKIEQRDLEPRSQMRKLAAIKSLLDFAHRTGYLTIDPGKAVPLPKIKNDLAERIISEKDLLKMIALDPELRNQVLIRLLYVIGGRVSVIVGASWRDLQSREEGGQICLFGKRGKTRYVLLPVKLWRDLQELRAGASDDSPLFLSREGERLGRVQTWRNSRKRIYDNTLARPALWRTNFNEATRVHFYCSVDAGAGYWREHCNLQRRECGTAAITSLSGP